MRKRIGGVNGLIFNNVLAGTQMPPGVGVGGNADGHSKNGHKKNNGQQPGGSEPV
jgi:hypothetical protein